MRGPRVVSVAQKKPDAEILKKRKVENKTTKEKAPKKTAARKDSNAPKRPPTAFFVFMEDFRKSYKESCPDNKSVSAVGKAGGEKWKSLSEDEKASYIKIAGQRKADYGKACEAYQKKRVENKTTKEKAPKKTAARKDSNAPKRPPTAFFVFMEDFRKSYKESCPDNKSVSAVGKAGGEKWKSLSEDEKASYIRIAGQRKADYGKACEAYQKKRNGDSVDEKPEISEKSEKSTSEVHDDDGQEASS